MYGCAYVPPLPLYDGRYEDGSLFVLDSRIEAPADLVLPATPGLGSVVTCSSLGNGTSLARRLLIGSMVVEGGWLNLGFCLFSRYSPAPAHGLDFSHIAITTTAGTLLVLRWTGDDSLLLGGGRAFFSGLTSVGLCDLFHTTRVVSGWAIYRDGWAR